MIHDHDQSWHQIHLTAPDLRQAVADAIRAGEPVNVSTFGPSPELPRGAEVAHFPSNFCAWIATNSDAACFEVPYNWIPSTIAAVVHVIETVDPVECDGLPIGGAA